MAYSAAKNINSNSKLFHFAEAFFAMMSVFLCEFKKLQ